MGGGAGEEAGPGPGDGARGGEGEGAGGGGGATRVVVGIEIDLERVRVESAVPWMARLAAERGVNLALLDARARPLAVSDPKAARGAAAERVEAFETLLPFWRLRASPGDNPEEARAEWQRILLQSGMVVLLLATLVTGAGLAARAVRRSLELARLKADFISNVSHELRTPLTSIRMFGELLRSGRVRSTEKQNEYLEIIGRETERLGRMVDDILDFARHESSRKSYRLALHDLAEVATGVLEDMRSALEGEGFKVEVDVRGPLPPVRIDEDEIAAAVRNLLSNARKYSPERKEVRLAVRAASGRVLCEVSDRGAGIEPRDLPRVFEKFYRGGDSLTRSVPGSGLGLALVKRIVEDQGGLVEAESVKGEGSTFRISLPAANGGEKQNVEELSQGGQRDQREESTEAVAKSEPPL